MEPPLPLFFARQSEPEVKNTMVASPGVAQTSGEILSSTAADTETL
jgi:hypothetical protein